MKLTDLDAQFLQRQDEGRRLHCVDLLEDADGLWFLCPHCYSQKGSKAGVHGVICWFKNRVPDEAEPGPGRWTPTGTNLDNLNLTPSVHLNTTCGWHGYVTNGEAK